MRKGIPDGMLAVSSYIFVMALCWVMLGWAMCRVLSPEVMGCNLPTAACIATHKSVNATRLPVSTVT